MQPRPVFFRGRFTAEICPQPCAAGMAKTIMPFCQLKSEKLAIAGAAGRKENSCLPD